MLDCVSPTSEHRGERTMRAVTLIQPWATLIISGAKRIETRSWRTVHRGLWPIHSSRTSPPAARALCAKEPFKSCLAAAGIADHEQLPLGVVLGSVDLYDCQAMDLMDLSQLSEQERSFGDYRPGRY